MRLWFIRHGETEHNINGIFQGQLDTELTDVGRRQAEATARALARVPFARILASDLKRAFHTAEHIAGGRDISVEPDARLREMHYGVLQGVAYGDFQAVLRSHGVGESWGRGVFSVDGAAPPGGESLADLVERTTAFIADVTQGDQPEAEIAVVTHGGTIRTMMTELLGMDPQARHALKLGNCGVTCFSREEEGWSQSGWNLEFHNRLFWDDGFGRLVDTV